MAKRNRSKGQTTNYTENYRLSNLNPTKLKRMMLVKNNGSYQNNWSIMGYDG
jgi:hypothetical protein